MARAKTSSMPLERTTVKGRSSLIVASADPQPSAYCRRSLPPGAA
jgi:hypothetical protein